MVSIGGSLAGSRILAKKVAGRIPIRMCALLLGLLLSSCASVAPQKKGGVLFYESDGRPPASIFGLAMAAHSLEFPNISIGKMGSTMIEVRDLPVAILPRKAWLTVAMWDLDRPPEKQPWRSTEFLVRLSEPSGKVINERRIRLRDWEGQSHSDHWFAPPRISIPIIPLELADHPPESATSYDLTISVLTPSRRKSDRLSIRASRSYFDSLGSLPMDLPGPAGEPDPEARR